MPHLILVGMRRTLEQQKGFVTPEGKLELSFGHVKRSDKDDLRSGPGWQRDENAGFPLSRLQKLQREKKWATVANLMSLSRPIAAGIGTYLFAKGHTAAGIGALAYAGVSDLEGNVARWTGTDDPKLGAKMDVVGDFAAAAVIGVGSLAGGIVPAWGVAGIYGPKVINAVNSGIAEHSGLNPFTEKVDKAIEVLRWPAVGLFFADYATSGSMELAEQVGVAAVALGGLYASFRQIKRHVQARRQKRKTTQEK